MAGCPFALFTPRFYLPASMASPPLGRGGTVADRRAMRAAG